jgi:hypothetical protein
MKNGTPIALMTADLALEGRKKAIHRTAPLCRYYDALNKFACDAAFNRSSGRGPAL